MLNEQIVVAVTPFSGTKDPDKNGNYPVMLQLIAGRMPNRNVLSGTVALRAGIEAGKTYLMQVREQGIDKVYGTDYTFIKIQELTTAKDIIEASKALGKPDLFVVERPAGFEKLYERKTDAVEGLRTKRIREGQYIPAVRSITDHETAPEVLEGTSINNRDKRQDLTEEMLKGNGKNKTDMKE